MIKPKKIKKPIDVSTSKSLSETAIRVAYLTDGQMKKLKKKSITMGISIRDLLDKSLDEVMSDEKFQFEKINVNATKRSFAINQTRLQEMKIFLIDQERITQDGLIYNSVLKIIK
jgi:hypothetical protein